MTQKLINFGRRKMSWKEIVGAFLVLTFLMVLGTGWKYRKLDVRDLEVYNIDKAASHYPDITIDDSHFDGTVRFDAYPPAQVNEITNAALGVWSKGTNFQTDSDSSPDGWLVWDQTNTGVTRIDVSDVPALGTGNTIYPGFTHAMEIKTAAASGISDYISYPSASGVSENETWYKKYAGKRVTFGAMVRTDIANNVRPYIITCNNARTAGTGNAAGVTPYAAYGSYGDGDAGWDFLTATTTVPIGATALEFGWEIDGTARTGPTAYVCGPTFTSGTTPTMPIPKPGEVVILEEGLNVWYGIKTSGGDTGASAFMPGSAQALDLSVDQGWNGIIPDDAEAILVESGISVVAVGDTLRFYGNTGIGGTTVYGLVAGTTNYAQIWVPVSYDGIVNVIPDDSQEVGLVLHVNAVQMR